MYKLLLVALRWLASPITVACDGAAATGTEPGCIATD